MQTRSQALGAVQPQTAQSPVPAGAPTICDECFQENGTHLDGCVMAPTQPPMQPHQAQASPLPSVAPVGGAAVAPFPGSETRIVYREPPITERIDATDHSVTVTWGEEIFQPVSFNTFRVGPFVATATVLAGESVGKTIARLYAELAEIARGVRAAKTTEYLAALKAMDAQVQQSAAAARR